ncbi:MAG TPA: alpha/beta hydrolase [Solirubrobacterales bacterium]|nr:alpha/beta hydrolase [Solirubrobacterales bacterium]
MAAQPPATIDLEGRRLAWRTLGAGPPLLLINGYAATSEDWDPTFLGGLAETFQLICPDNRGTGGSELGDAELTVDGMASDLEAVLDTLEIARLPVVGWSMGGFVAQQLATRAPERVAALALIATDPGAPDATDADPEVWAKLTDHSGSAREQATRLINLLFPPVLAAEIDRDFGEIVAAARANLGPQTLRAQEAAMDAWHREPPPRGDASGIPTLVIHGEDDQVIPPANAAALATRWPGAEVELFNGCGHGLMAQEPQRLANLIRDVCG